MDVYKTLETMIGDKIRSYRSDLEIHDRGWIGCNPGIPFLHYTWESGTYIIGLLPAADYPAEGVKVKYLFSTADRYHLLAQVEKMVQHFSAGRMGNGGIKAIHHFDGAQVRPIADIVARDIARKYCEGITREWYGAGGKRGAL